MTYHKIHLYDVFGSVVFTVFRVVQLSSLSNFSTILSPQKETLELTAVSTHSPLPRSMWKTLTHFLSLYVADSGLFPTNGINNAWPFQSDFFH